MGLAKGWCVSVFLGVILMLPAVSFPEDIVRRGHDVYLRYCIGCHGEKGDGRGKGAKLLVVKPRDFTSGVFKFKSTPHGSLPVDEDLLRTVTRGLPGSSMPGFSLVAEAERRAVIVYIKTFSARWGVEKPQSAMVIPPPPDYVDTPDSAKRGQAVFEANGCASCHGEMGDGKGAAAAYLEDIWGHKVKPRNFVRGVFRAGSSSADLFRTVSTGAEGSAMPQFGHLPEGERWDLVSYLHSFRGAQR